MWRVQVECAEAAAVLRHATPSSLVVLDELGRGTSTFDGYAIAHATLAYLVEQVHAPLAHPAPWTALAAPRQLPPAPCAGETVLKGPQAQPTCCCAGLARTVASGCGCARSAPRCMPRRKRTVAATAARCRRGL
jgi:hypothetical protein